VSYAICKKVCSTRPGQAVRGAVVSFPATAPSAVFLRLEGGGSLKQRRKQFVCLWTLNLQAIMECWAFTIEEKGFIFTLLPFLRYQDNTIRYFDDRPARQKDIADMAGYSVVQTARLLKSLERKNAVKKMDGAYVLNPCIAWKGTELDREYRIQLDRFCIEVGSIKEKEKVAQNYEAKTLVVTDVYRHKVPIMYDG
jgi:hypothetical protein